MESPSTSPYTSTSDAVPDTKQQNGTGTNGVGHTENGDAATTTTTTTTTAASPPTTVLWVPTGTQWRDYLHFLGPGWLVSIAYIDPGNYQADIQAGASAGYSLLFVVWWTSVLCVYVQILCVRLAYYGGMNLAEAQARATHSRTWHRYLNWAVAEFSTVLTDLPEVIGIGIACNIFFGWPYWVGVVLSLFTTMSFLAVQNYGIRTLEIIIFAFVGVMALSLWVEMGDVGVDSGELMRGWVIGFTEVRRSDIFAIAGILGAVVMPHNLYLHSAVCQTRPVRPEHAALAVKYSSYEPILPIVVSFFINMAVVSIATESFGDDLPEDRGKVGLTTFEDYLQRGSFLFGIALLASGQSSAITTTFTGQYVMDGFLRIRLPTHWRAIMTRLIAITPCVLVSAAVPHQVNQLVNLVNASLSVLLPFALTPLVRYNCSPEFMGPKHAARGKERIFLYCLAFGVWAVNATTLSVKDGGFFGDWRARVTSSFSMVVLIVIEVSFHLFYLWWNIDCMTRKLDQREEPAEEASLAETPNGEII